MRNSIVLAIAVLLSTVGTTEIYATQIMADGFASSEDCGGGLRTVKGFHAAVLNLLSTEDENKTWQLRGSVWNCDYFFPNKVTWDCSVSGNTTPTKFLSCDTQADVGCFRVESGVQSKETATIVNGGPSDSHVSYCTASVNCDNPPAIVFEPAGPLGDESDQE